MAAKPSGYMYEDGSVKGYPFRNTLTNRYIEAKIRARKKAKPKVRIGTAVSYTPPKGK